MTSTNPIREQQPEGITVIGEAVRRVAPENAEILVEIGAAASSAAQAVRENQNRVAQLAQALSSLGVQRNDIQTVGMNVFNLYTPLLPGMPPGLPQIPAPMQPEVQFGSYQARTALRITVKEAARVGEIVDAATRAGATLAAPFSIRPADEAAARRSALEAAGRDARAKAETLAAAAGKQVGDPVAIAEDVVASNGAFAALRAVVPTAFGGGAPQASGELEYYARVSASFRFQ